MSEYFSSSTNSSDSWSSSSYSDFTYTSPSYSTFDFENKPNPQKNDENYNSSFPRVQDFKKSQHQNQKSNSLYAAYEQRNKRNSYSDQNYETSTDNQSVQSNSQRTKESISKSESIKPPLAAKKLQDFTIRQVLQLSLSRQSYLKSLSLPQINEQIEYKYIFSHPNYVFDIGHYYKKEITDEQLKRQIVKTRARSDIIGPVYIASIGFYIYFIDRLQKYSPFKGDLAKTYHIAIPLAIVGLASLFQGKIQNRRRNLLENKQNEIQFAPLIRKYLCDTTEKQRRTILRKSKEDQKSSSS